MSPDRCELARSFRGLALPRFYGRDVSHALARSAPLATAPAIAAERAATLDVPPAGAAAAISATLAAGDRRG